MIGGAEAFVLTSSKMRYNSLFLRFTSESWVMYDDNDCHSVMCVPYCRIVRKPPLGTLFSKLHFATQEVFSYEW